MPSKCWIVKFDVIIDVLLTSKVIVLNKIHLKQCWVLVQMAFKVQNPKGRLPTDNFMDPKFIPSIF